MANLDGTLVYVFNNQTGNVEALYKADSSNELLAEYEYTPFGETRRQSGELSNKNPLRYSTRYHEGNTGLYYYGFRHYSPVTKKWLSQDPIAEQGGLNLYRFANSNPANLIDVLGLCDKCYIIINMGHGDDGNNGNKATDTEQYRLSEDSVTDDAGNRNPNMFTIPVGCFSQSIANALNGKYPGSVPSGFKGANNRSNTIGSSDFNSDGSKSFLGGIKYWGQQALRNKTPVRDLMDDAINLAEDFAKQLCDGLPLSNGKKCKSVEIELYGGTEKGENGETGQQYVDKYPGLQSRINKLNEATKDCNN